MKPILYHRKGVPVGRYAEKFELREADAPPEEAGYRLWYDDTGMTLLHGFRGSLRLDYRAIESRSAQSLLLARACIASGRPSIVDLMAGWGIDGLSLALRGCTVTLVERATVVWAMLDEFVARLELPASVVFASAEDWCREHRKTVGMAYLDPMFPARRKTALPGKEMQYLRDLAWSSGAPLASQISLARSAASERVVVKRRIGDPALPAPNWQLRGRRIRFDIYVAE